MEMLRSSERNAKEEVYLKGWGRRGLKDEKEKEKEKEEKEEVEEREKEQEEKEEVVGEEDGILEAEEREKDPVQAQEKEEEATCSTLPLR